MAYRRLARRRLSCHVRFGRELQSCLLFGCVLLVGFTLFCLVDIAGLQLETSLVQRSSWCLAIILGCFQ